MLRLLLQGKMVLGRAPVRLLEADHLLRAGCVETFVQHLSLVAQIVPMLRVCIGRKSGSLSLIISVRHSLVATSMIVCGRCWADDRIPATTWLCIGLLVLLYLLLRGELLIARRTEAPLTQR